MWGSGFRVLGFRVLVWGLGFKRLLAGSVNSVLGSMNVRKAGAQIRRTSHAI